MFDTKEYKTLEGLSKSALSDLLNDPYLFYLINVKQDEKVRKEYLDKKTKSTIMGDLVDAFLTNPKSIPEHCVVSTASAGESLEEVLKHVFNKIISTPDLSMTNTNGDLRELSDFDTQVADTLSVVSYYNNWKMETRVKDVITKGGAYFKEMAMSMGKQIIPMVTYTTAQIVSENMKAHKSTRQYCVPDDEYIDQLALQGEAEGVKLKGLLDRVIFKPGKVIQPLDFKTSQHPERFIKSYMDYQYFKQGGMYDTLLRQNYPEHTILPFKFVVGFTEAYIGDGSESKYYPMSAVYTMTEADCHFAWTGGIAKDGKYYYGFNEALAYWHYCAERAWDVPMASRVSLPSLNPNQVVNEIHIEKGDAF